MRPLDYKCPLFVNDMEGRHKFQPSVFVAVIYSVFASPYTLIFPNILAGETHIVFRQS